MVGRLKFLDSRTHGDLMISLRPPATEWEIAWKANNESHPLVNDWCFIGVGLALTVLAKQLPITSLWALSLSTASIDTSLAMQRQEFKSAHSFRILSTYGRTVTVAMRSTGAARAFLIWLFCKKPSRRNGSSRVSRFEENSRCRRTSACFDTRAESTLLRLVA